MKALTIRQPWAGAIVHQTKRVENRTWKLPADVLAAVEQQLQAATA